MPAPLDVNWEAVRMLAISVGVREAARRTGLTESSVMQRSAREGWLANLPRSTPLPRTVLQPVSGVSKAPDALGNFLREGANGYRVAAAKVGKRLAATDEDELMTPGVAEAAQKWAGVAAKAGLLTGGAEGVVRLEVLARMDGSQIVDIEAEPVEPVESGPNPEIGIETGQIEG